MPRRGQVKEKRGDRLVDRVGLGVLAAQFPDALLDEVVAETGRRERRTRDLPAALTLRYVIALALFPSDGYDEVMRQVKVADDWCSDRAGPVKVPATTAITRARDRLGVEPVKLLFERTAVAMALPQRTVGAFYRGWRVCAVDGTTLLVPDTDENAAAFGKPGNDQGEGALPQVRVLGLVECGTRALLGAGFGGTGGSKAASEQALFDELLPALCPDLLVLADRNFLGFELFEKAAATGADLLWRAKADRRLPVDVELPDGSYLSHLVAPATRGRGRKITVRVVEYTLDRDPDTGQPLPASKKETYRLVTTVPDPAAAPAAELAALYSDRWEVETLLDEIKVHQQDGRLVLRSRTPDRIEQELWGVLLLHRALRKLIHDTALREGIDPDRLSFTHTVSIVRRQVVRRAIFPPPPDRPDPRSGDH
ncbi:IS4 family transposase [Frankia sp. Cr2]|uniref:IS4 family transposase n=1 Tax=Frankia sp. Cr2 TaxID=3073932 RepID=UPI002AD2E66E|nr:IS4 family transposase [Frankia sp. Cr2]